MQNTSLRFRHFLTHRLPGIGTAKTVIGGNVINETIP
jgi:hypothetical protein